MSKVCKDCVPGGHGVKSSMVKGGLRPAPHPGPRCATHHRERQKALQKAAHEARVGKVYGLKPGQYEAMYEAQGGKCYICRRATGKTKRLAVDHDHETGYVRGLLCNPCNKFLGHLRDDPDAGFRVGEYLVNPPAYGVIGKVKPDDND